MPLNEQIKELIKQTLAKREPVYFSAAKVHITFQTLLKEIEPGALKIKNAVAPDYIQRVVDSGKFYLQIGTLRFESTRISSDGEQIVFPIIDTYDLKDIRQEQRFTFTPQENVICEILNPYDLKTLLKREVIEISSSGLSIRNFYQSKLFVAGTDLPTLKVFINGEQYLSKKGAVVYSRQLMNLKGESFFQTGIKFH